jgi:long-chain acyl-CoA synthetase
MGGSTSSTAFDYNEQLVKDTKLQSQEKKVEAKDGEGVPRLDLLVNDEKLWTVPELTGATTLYEFFQKSVESFPDHRMLGTRSVGEDGKVENADAMIQARVEGGDPGTRGFDWLTYSEVKTLSHDFGAGLTTLDNAAGANIGLFAGNRAHWIVAQQGIYAQNMRVVSLYATLGESAVEYITNHAELSTVITNGKNLPTLLAVLSKIAHTSPEGHVKHIIRMPEADPISDEDIKTAQAQGVTLHDWDAVSTAGAESKVEDNPPSPDDWAFIMYTSGTTGPPKGAILTHGNLIATLSTTRSRIQLDDSSRHLSYLPLAHIFETVVQATVFQSGGCVGFFQGSIKTLTDDMKALEPTIFAGVPRVFDKMYKKIFATVESGSCAMGWYFNRAYEGTCEIVRVGGQRDESWDTKVFNKIAKEKLGLGECKLIVTGAAPCPAYLAEFLKVVVSCPVVQGYGMTETAAAATIQNPTDPTLGHNGPPLACCEIKLVDVPEMGYHANDQPFSRGEIWIKGGNIFKGYYKNEKSTAGALKDGWLLTGDIGRWNNNGTLSIIDRKKNIFKLSQGYSKYGQCRVEKQMERRRS